MADVAYNTSSFPALISTLANLLILSNSTDPLILLAYKERDEAERTLWSMMHDQLGVTLQKVDSILGAGGHAVEIWLGRRS